MDKIKKYVIKNNGVSLSRNNYVEKLERYNKIANDDN